MAFDEDLAERVRRYFAAERLPVEEKRMMGGLCFMVRGKMCVGVEKERLMARIGPDREAEALARRGCTPMDFTGRPMRGYVFVSRDGFTRDDDLNYWLGLALDFNPQAKASKSAHAARTRRASPEGQDAKGKAGRAPECQSPRDVIARLVSAGSGRHEGACRLPMGRSNVLRVRWKPGQMHVAVSKISVPAHHSVSARLPT